ncbi:hypothetical protein QZH41_006150 [Actinostola sp. cb2023]|nr:hypothetical protein QZH41_006150 [Actinostola sp. cb2023]
MVQRTEPSLPLLSGSYPPRPSAKNACVMQYQKWELAALDNFDIHTFPAALGILVASYLSQPFVPVIEGSMRRKEKFNLLMNLAYTTMTLLNVVIGFVAFVSFQPHTAEVVTNNLPEGSFRATINVMAALLAFTSYTLPMFTIFDVIQNANLPCLKDTFGTNKLANVDALALRIFSIQGLGLLAMPLAASYGGYWFIIGTIAVAACSCYTSKVLIQCLYEEHPTKGRTRIRETYSDVGEAFWPRYGRHMVIVAKFVELMFSATANPIACGEALVFLYPNLAISTRVWILIFGLGMVANIFLNSVLLLSKISMMTIILGLGTFGTVIGYSFYQLPVWDINDMLVFKPAKFPLSLGMLVASYSAQIYLAVLEVSMKSPEKFNTILNYSYSAMTVLKLMLGVFGYLAFSKDVNEVVTNNLPPYFLVPMNIIVIFLAFTGYSLPMFAIFDMIESSANRFLGTRCLDEFGQRPKTFCKYLMRLTLVGITIIMATVVPYFSLILAFVGSVSGTSIAVIFPCLFHVKLYWDYLTWYQVILNVVIAVFGILMAVSGVTYSIIDLMEIVSR